MKALDQAGAAVAVLVALALGAVSSVAAAGCGVPAGATRSTDDSETSGGEDEDEEEEEDEDEDEEDLAASGGQWAPRASLARVEDIPRAGLVEERPSRTGAVRVIALLPLDDTGNRLIELIGLPALAGDEVVASLRAAHDTPRWTGCSELTFVIPGTDFPVTDTTYEAGVSSLGVMEAIQGRLSVANLEAAAAGEALAVRSCEDGAELLQGPAVLADFLERFEALRPAPGAAADPDGPDSADATPGEEPAIVNAP